MRLVPRRRIFVLVVLGSLWLVAASDAGWREIATPDYQLHTIRAIDGEAYLGGARIGKRGDARSLTGSVILKFDGRTWAPVYEGPFKGRFWAIAGSRDSIYAISDGAIVHFDGAAWKDITTPAVENLKFRFLVPRGRNTYFLDQGGTVFRFDGATWSRENVPSKGVVSAVWSDDSSGAYLLVTLMAYSAGGRTSTVAGRAVYRFDGSQLHAVPHTVIGNRARVEAETRVQSDVVRNDRYLRGYSDEQKRALIRGRVLTFLSPAYLLLENGGIFVSRVEPDVAVDEANLPDVKARIANVPRTPGGLLVAPANEQTLRDASPYPQEDWVLVSNDGVSWKKLTDVYAGDGRPGPDHAIQVLPDGQIFVINLDRAYHYDGRGDIFGKPEKAGTPRTPASQKRR